MNRPSCLILVQFNEFSWIKCQMLIVKDITQLICDTLSIANFHIHIIV